MGPNGVIQSKVKGRVTLRVRSLKPHTSEMTALQLGVLADIADSYGSGMVHITPRQSVEIPHIDGSSVGEITALLERAGLAPGSSDNYLRNVIACSRWCLYNAAPLSTAAQKLNSMLQSLRLPAKTNISLSGCDFSCVRSRTSDIGVISRQEVYITGNKCKKCSLCLKPPLGCQVDAITLTDDGVSIDQHKCVRCGFCVNACPPGTIAGKRVSYDVLIGGKGGVNTPREAVYLTTADNEDELVATVGRLLDTYTRLARESERIGDIVNRAGLEAFIL